MKKTFMTVAVTALVTCLITMTVKDVMYVQSRDGADYKLKNVMDVLDNFLVYDIDRKAMTDAASKAMLETAGDEYTHYYSSEEFQKFMEEVKNNYVGIGVTVTPDANVNKVLVVSVTEGGAAEKAGILSGDYIVSVNGTEYPADKMDDLVSAIRGNDAENPEGETVTLGIDRDGKRLVVPVVRSHIEQDTVTSKVLDNDIGYLRITQFCIKDAKVENSKDTLEDFIENMESLKSQNIKSLIIDLRNNPGGDLDMVKGIADYLLPSGTILYTEDKFGERVYYNSDENAVSLPMAVLINSGSASASEVLSGALRDYKVATLVGEKTFGKGVVQTIIPLYDNSGLVITSSRYFTPSGECIHEKGIEPHVPVSLNVNKSVSSLTYEEDLQLQKAVEILSK